VAVRVKNKEGVNLRPKYRSIGLLLVFVLVFALIPAIAMAATVTQGVKGVITDKLTGGPIPFATVSLLSTTTVWSAAYDGTYAIPTTVGSETVRAWAGSHATSLSPEFRVAANTVVTQNLVLDRFPNFEQPVYRFFNMTGGVHFYTASDAEFISVYKNLPNYKYDGIGYWVPVGPSIPATVGAPGWTNQNTVVLQRFYNKQAGVHFYTADVAEYTKVKNTLQSVYTYDGPAYNVTLTAPVDSFALIAARSSVPIFRFYNGTANAHFYTADTSEIFSPSAVSAIAPAALSQLYKFEGTAFYTGGWLWVAPLPDL
jgi:hypothetical protein